ncbi:SGNH/GDSL hydrolase family protein [Lentzea sp. BCCO 10_0856]|uniref:SGNH/GDSL hydrolase family protein n=1 Tax=Lentzea miocenica TaxID=3095431 RepID=A0ABU4TEH6_9PSEU|nr:SGNH/GDSL hydrolase family protein [Lentzea sp. BCCO 10_0856]MDX8036583.1 SGNH/GDSL hydrolase family protein [Lentzea sp. BCCO 10_0856]
MRIVAGLVFVAALVAGTTTAQADTFDYVALGDSAAAGPLIPNQDPALWCLRSDRNYPQVAAKQLGATLTDVTCSGAKTDDFAGRQFGFVAPQYDALKPSTDLVSLTIGANDIGLFQTALSCINLLPEPAGLSCQDRYNAGGTDQLAAAVAAWAPEFGAALDEIKRRSPNAKLLVSGYGTYIRPGGCYPRQPVWGRDGDYLQSVMNRISATAKAEATKRGATFVDFAAVTVGHDICAAPADRYLEGLIPTTIAAPLHPNAAGMQAFGTAVAKAAK